MTINAEIIDLDELFRTSLRAPIIVNHFNIQSDTDKEEINRLILTQYGSDFLEIEPSCDCGTVRGGYNEGVLCPYCNTHVMPVTERPLETSVWLGLPKGVKKYINPKVYSILAKRLTISKFNILEHLVNPSAGPPETKNAVVAKYMRLNIPRGINHFYDNFEDLIAQLTKENILLRDSEDKTGGKGRHTTLMEFIAMYRDRLFCDHLPLPTKLMMITEATMTTTFASTNMMPALDAVRTISSTENSPAPLNLKTLQSRAMKANGLMALYNELCFKDFFDQKEGWFRQHVYGTRSHFTFRGVINSNTEAHHYEELHIPWSLAVMVFRIHVCAKLIRNGWSLREAQALLDENTLRYNPVLDAIFEELIREAPGGRIAVLFNRNPSLLRGSMQLLYITKVKKEVAERSISISVMILKNLNADFDGDALNGMVILDNKMQRKLNRLAPHLTILDTNKPRSLSRAMQMPEPTVTTAASWAHRGR
jgi:hypothetical protein